jgi:hypothetical protein
MYKSKQAVIREPESFGYVRVSMKDQNEDRQLIALKPYDLHYAKKSTYSHWNRRNKVRGGGLTYGSYTWGVNGFPVGKPLFLFYARE